jgi:hypothetical protein
VPGVAIFRQYKLEEIPTLELTPNSNVNSIRTRAAHNKVNIVALATFLSGWESTVWAKRIESSNIDIYINDKQLYQQLLEKFASIVVLCYEPDESNLSILENTGSIVAKKFPHDKYHYKAYLLPHRIKNKESKKELIEWIDGQNERILISDSVKYWFISTEYNWDRRYVLVEDEYTLLMLKLRSADSLGRVYNYVISDK